MIIHGTVRNGKKNHNTKLKESDIPTIRKLLSFGTTSMCQIGKRYFVNAATIRDIRDKRTWAHVK